MLHSRQYFNPNFHYSSPLSSGDGRLTEERHFCYDLLLTEHGAGGGGEHGRAQMLNQVQEWQPR